MVDVRERPCVEQLQAGVKCEAQTPCLWFVVLSCQSLQVFLAFTVIDGLSTDFTGH